MKRLKLKYLVVAALSIMFVQCSEKHSQFEDDASIRFSVSAADGPVTKGVISNALRTSGSAFRIIGAHADSKSKFADGSIKCFDNQLVSWSGSEWTYDTPRYWVANSHYRFRAVHPAASATSELYTDDLNSSARLRFTVDSNPANQVDLLMTDLKSVDYIPSGSNVVDLLFKHLLCRVNVNIKTVADAVDRFTIESISIIGPGSEWTLDLTSTDGGDTWTPDWKRVPGSPNRQFASGVTGLITSTTGTSCFGSGLLLVPESNSNAKLQVKYTIEHDNGGGSWSTPKPNTVEYAFPASPAWQAGKDYTYTLTMYEQYNITFGTPTVRDWGEVRNTGTIVIK